MTLDSNKKKLIIRRVWIALLIILLSVLQNTDGFFPQIFEVRALLLIPAVICTAMFERDIAGMFFGLFAGALWDVFSSGGDFNALYLMTCGFLCGTLINTIMRNNLVTAAIMSVTAVTVYSLGYWAFHYAFIPDGAAAHMLLKYYLPGIAYTSAFIPILFIIIRNIEKHYSPD